jgi:hypothetical protein
VTVKLITKELEKKLPPIDHFKGADANTVPVVARFVASTNAYYVWEYDPQSRRFWGLVKGREVRVGFFTVRSMEGRFAQPDHTWKPKTLSELADQFGLGWLKTWR